MSNICGRRLFSGSAAFPSYQEARHQGERKSYNKKEGRQKKRGNPQLTWCPAILIKRGNAPWVTTTPLFTSVKPNLACSSATTKSQLTTISIPPPYAPPLTAAIMGLFDCRLEMEPKPSLLSAIRCRSVGLPACSALFHLQSEHEPMKENHHSGFRKGKKSTCFQFGRCGVNNTDSVNGMKERKKQCAAQTYSLRSAPAQKRRPSPVNTATLEIP